MGAVRDSQGQSTMSRVADDGLVIDRVAEAAKRDLPTDLLKRIVNEDIDLLRGKRPDGSYDYAKYERFESGRVVKSFSINDRKDRMETVENRGSWIYRIVVEVPTRRMLVRKNRPVWIERIDVDAIPEGSTQSRSQSFEVKAWLQPGEVRPFDRQQQQQRADQRMLADAQLLGQHAGEVAHPLEHEPRAVAVVGDQHRRDQQLEGDDRPDEGEVRRGDGEPWNRRRRASDGPARARRAGSPG